MRSLLDISVCVVMLCIYIHGATSTATVSFNQSTYFTKDGNFMLTLTLDGDKTLPADTVKLLVKDSDDDNTSYNLTFSMDQSEAHINVTLPVDKLSASFFIDSKSVVPSNVSVGEINHTTVERIPKHVRFAKDKYKVNENNGSVFIQLTLDEKSSSDIAVKVNNLDTSKDDYSPGPYIITIHAGDTTALFNISICNDGILEGDESISLLIDSFYNDIVTGGGPYQTAVTIIDTTIISVYFNQSTYQVNENDKLLYAVLVHNGTSAFDFTVKINSTDILANRKSDDKTGDFEIETPVVTFYKGTNAALLNISIIDDNLLEQNETFNLTIDGFSLPSNVRVGKSVNTTVTILNDDKRIPKHVSFAKDKYKVNENNGSVFIQLTLDEKSSSDIAVKVNNLDTSKDDYSPGPYIVTIHAGNTTALLNISICNDGILEGDESIILLIDSFYNDIVTGSDQYQTVVTIIDTTIISVYFNQSKYQVNESDKLLHAVLVHNGTSAFDFTVKINFTDILANRKSDDKTGDFEIETPVVTFYKGTNATSLNISIIDDNLMERNETFNLTIDGFSLPSNVRVGKPVNTTVTILNNDTASVYFEDSAYSIIENEGTLPLTLVLSNPSSFDITVHLYNANGSSATPDEDYGSKYDVTFHKNITKVSLNITINDDKLLEPDEKFTLTINSASLPSNVNVDGDNPDSATVTILNDDYNTISFSQSTYTGKVGDTVDIELVLDHPLNSQSDELPVNITYVSDDGLLEEPHLISFINQTKSQTISVVVTQNGTVFISDKNYPFFKIDDLKNTTSIIAMPNKATNITEDPTPNANPSTTNDTTDTGSAPTSSTNSAPTSSTNSAPTSSTNSAPTSSTNSAPTTNPSTTDESSGGFSSLFYVSIILLLILAPVAYVSYQNREKISGLLSGRKGARRGGRVKYQLLPSSIGEALRSGHRD